jgi:hypothetical protein
MAATPYCFVCLVHLKAKYPRVNNDPENIESKLRGWWEILGEQHEALTWGPYPLEGHYFVVPLCWTHAPAGTPQSRLAAA